MTLKKTVTNGELLSSVYWSPYLGMELKGWPVQTIVNGHTVFLDGEVDKSVRGREICFA